MAFSCRCFVDGISSGPSTGAVNLCERVGGTLSPDGHLCMELEQPYTNQMCLDYFRGEAGWQADCVARPPSHPLDCNKGESQVNNRDNHTGVAYVIGDGKTVFERRLDGWK
jgi:hypothetical protein